MTFDELKKIKPNATKNGWHRHKNGGGWVQNSAYVESSVFVGKNAIVCDAAKVYDKVVVCDRAEVSGVATVRENAVDQRFCSYFRKCYNSGFNKRWWKSNNQR